MTDVEQRLASLERTARIQRFGLLWMGVVLGVVVLAGARAPMPDVVRAEGFEVVDGNGKALVAIGSDEDGGLFTIRNRLDQPVISAYADDDGGVVLVKNSHGRDVALVAADENGRGLVNLRDHTEKATIVLGGDPDGGFIEIRDKVESPALFAGVLEGGLGTVFTLDTDGNRLWTSPGK